MNRPSSITRRLRIGLVALTVALAGVATPTADALAGFATSPGLPGIIAKCASGTHIPDVALLSRKAGKGPLDY